MNNYEFCAKWAAHEVSRGGPVLDYGCGAGQIVAALRVKGIEAYGCDMYLEAPEAFSNVPPIARPYIKRMETHRIPFADASFDCIVSNQVIEHIDDLEAFITEITRVLKPGGVSMHLFPDRGVWIEGHANIPFLHWFAKDSRFRVPYAALMSRLGFGLPLLGKTRVQRYADKCRWLDEWTHYRTRGEIMSHFRQSFAVEYIEPDLFDARAGRMLPLPRIMKTWVARKLAGCAVVLRPVAHRMPAQAPPVLM